MKSPLDAHVLNLKYKSLHALYKHLQSKQWKIVEG